MVKVIAIMKYNANKSIRNNFCHSKIHIPENTTEVTNMIKAEMNFFLNMLCKILIIIKRDS